jgi:fatty-acyl-CoA synthase
MPALQNHFKYWPEKMPRELAYPETSLYYNLEVTAARYPDKAASIFYGTHLNYHELKRQVDALAGFLQKECGVKRGDRVLLYMQNSPQFVVAYYAILRADAMVVPVNVMNLAAELKHYVQDADARVAISGQELYPNLAPHFAPGMLEHIVVAAYSDYATAATDLNVPDLVRAPRARIDAAGVTLWSDALAANHQPGPHLAGPDDYCVMPYTSGTTGQPKGCIHTHRTVMNTTVGGGLWYGVIPEGVALGSLPMFHVTGMQGSLNQPIYWAATVVHMQRWDRNTAAELIQRHKVTSWGNISTMAVDFLANPDLAKYDLSSLKRIGGGGAAMPEAVAQKLKDVTGLAYVEGYGLSETMAPSHINPPQRPMKQCLGIPMFGVDSRIVNPDTLQELGVNEVGEIITHGGQVFLGYWKNPQATAQAFIELDGKRFFRTGDLARYDEDGYFYMVDRLKRMINASGYKVWPAEVEAIMYHHPDILEACVIGASDPARGETVKACVVLKVASRGKVTEAGIINWCKDNMAAYKYPRIVEFMETLPKSGTGKVQWRVLQDLEKKSQNPP